MDARVGGGAQKYFIYVQGCHHWNRLVDQPWRIIFIGMRDWAHRF